jgi:UDP-glucose 4-epimerase
LDKRILITGAAGFMGSHLADYLRKDGHEIWAIDDLSGGYRENLPADSREWQLSDNRWIPVIEGDPKTNFVNLDVRDTYKTHRLIEHVKPHIVYHLAADATEGRSQFHPNECNSRNLSGYLNVLTPAIDRRTNPDLEKVVLCSSMSVYGKQKPPFTEEMPREPEDVYAASKATMELDTEILASVHKFRHTILRPHNVYGPRQNMADPYRNVVAIWVNALLRGKPFYIYGDGKQKRAFSYIDDINPCMAAAGLDSTSDGEIINLGPFAPASLNKLATVVLQEFGASGNPALQPKYLPDRPREVKFAYSTQDKAERLLGFEAKTTLEEGIRKFVAWAKQAYPQGLEPQYVDRLELESPDLPKTWKEKLY